MMCSCELKRTSPQEVGVTLERQFKGRLREALWVAKLV